MVNLKLFDTAGQEKYRSVSKSYFRNTDGVLFVYAVDNLESFEDMKDWINLFMENHNGKKDIPLYLIENKNDLDRKVEEYLIDDFLTENKFKFKSISAKLNDDNVINELFQELSEQLYINYKQSGNYAQKSLKVENYKKKKKKKKNNCCEADID